MEVAKKAEFEHNGFACTVISRPDLCYTQQVHGFRKSDKKHFIPKIKFDKSLSFEQIRDATIAMIDGTFSGEIQVYGNLHVWEGK